MRSPDCTAPVCQCVREVLERIDRLAVATDEHAEVGPDTRERDRLGILVDVVEGHGGRLLGTERFREMIRGSLDVFFGRLIGIGRVTVDRVQAVAFYADAAHGLFASHKDRLIADLLEFLAAGGA